MILALVGESASGKTTTANMFADSDMNFKRVITYTTRPPREGEENGIDYHFVSEEEFDTLVAKLKGENVEVLTDVSVSAKGIKTFFFRDIDGNILHLIYRPTPLV